MDTVSKPASRSSVLRPSQQIEALLARLHAENSKQEASYGRLLFQIRFTFYCLWNWQSRDLWNSYCDLHCEDEMLSHSREKCELIYMLACVNGSKSIVECGTSFGVSTIYLALAACANAHGKKGDGFGVLTMEKSRSKLEKARKIWKEAGSEVEDWIDAYEGDLLELLENEAVLPPVVDLLFLDAWTSLAMPALKMVLPRLRHGSLVFVDKTSTGRLLYADLFEFVHDPANCFMNMTIPFAEGFEVMVYRPHMTTET